MEVILNALGSALGIAILGGIFKLVEWGLHRKAQKEDRAEDRQNELADRAEAEEDREDATTEEKLNEVIEIVRGLQKAERYMLKMEIERRATICLEQGSISSKELECITPMHEIYHVCLNGNGFLDSLMEKVKNLQIKN